MRTLRVELAERSYPIYIGPGLLTNRELFLPAIGGKQVLIVTNEKIAPLYLGPLLSLFTDKQVDSVVLPDGEQYKNLETLNRVYDQLLQKRHNRTTTLIALGGGVVGDMTGFAAATYQRGVSFIQVPTTLLSQVDSSVGGKTGVNHLLGKNMIGAFHQPRSVIIDVDVLKTLPLREFSAGLAEVIKYGLINDEGFFRWLENNIGKLLHGETDAVVHAIEFSCRNKAAIVAADERESGQRALLNLGHTFGHAIEAFQGYGAWLHGEAVAAGIAIAARVSGLKGWLSREDVRRIERLLSAAGLPINPPTGMSAADFFEKMQVDKKIVSGNIRYVLLQGIGKAVIDDSIEPSLVTAAIESSNVR